MAHEQSETIQRKDGKFINVYGSKLPKAGQQLPNSGTFSDVESAVKAAKKRSESFDEDEQVRKQFRSEKAAGGARTESFKEWKDLD